MLDKPSADGLYILWLILLETEDENDMRQVFDTAEMRSARITEGIAIKLQPEADHFENGVQLRRVQCRMGRMVALNDPVPRAGRTEQVAGSPAGV